MLTALVCVTGSEATGQRRCGCLPQLSIPNLLCPQQDPALSPLVSRVTQSFISEGPEFSIVLLYFYFGVAAVFHKPFPLVMKVVGDAPISQMPLGTTTLLAPTVLQKPNIALGNWDQSLKPVDSSFFFFFFCLLVQRHKEPKVARWRFSGTTAVTPGGSTALWRPSSPNHLKVPNKKRDFCRRTRERGVPAVGTRHRTVAPSSKHVLYPVM